MYKVFVVEDEIVTREGIRNSIPWDETAFTLVGEAPDGEMALHALRDIKPDILITDIKMPFMDGLALSRLIKKDFPWIKIMILSGHDEFQYAREAISIGVEEYLLKPVSAVEMLGSLNKIAKSIEDEKQRLNAMKDLETRALSAEEMKKDKWFLKLLTGQLNAMEIMEGSKDMGMDLHADSYVVMMAQCSRFADKYVPYSRIHLVLNRVIEARDDVFYYSQSMDKYILLIKNTRGLDMEDPLYSLAQAIKHEAESKLCCQISLGIGSVVERASDISASFNDADLVLRQILQSGVSQIVGIDDLRDKTQDSASSGAPLKSKHHQKMMQAKEYIRENFRDPDLSLNIVAEQVNFSPNHFSTVFSQEEGCTFIEYLTSTRMDFARNLLLMSSKKCSDITYEVGYRDPHYFSFIFKKNVGLSPREFRNRNKA